MQKPNRDRLYAFMANIIYNNNCIPFAIGGVEDHLHIVMRLHPSVALSDLVKDIKVSTAIWIKSEGIFPGFTSWQIGYAAFTYDQHALKNLVRYVQRQEEHHRTKTSFDEQVRLLKQHDVDYDEKYLR